MKKYNMLTVLREYKSNYPNGRPCRRYDFNLSKEEFIKIVTKPCIYCGSELTSCKDAKGQYGEFRYIGIDRYDNKILQVQLLLQLLD